MSNNKTVMNRINIDKTLPSNWPKITDDKMQKYLYDFYNNNNTEIKPPKYSNIIGTGNRCIKTNPILSLVQSSTYMVMKSIAQNGSENRGMLIYWSVGSGKTVVSASIMDSFWNTDKKIIFLSSVEGLKANPPKNFYNEANRYFDRFKNINAKNEKEKMEKIQKLFVNRKVYFLTFAKLAHLLLISRELKRVKTDNDKDIHRNFLKNSILIIDEVHNIFKPLPNQREEHTAIKNFLADHNNPFTTNLQIFILTATPGDSPKDIVELLNLIRKNKSEPITIPDINSMSSIDNFKNRIKGLVSYFDSSLDYSRFPRVYNLPKQIAYMDKIQFEKYVEKMNELKEEETDFNQLIKDDKSNDYYKSLRKYSNMLYDFVDNINLKEFSTKMPLLLENIQEKSKEKHYIYSSFYYRTGFGGHGINAIANILENNLGYSKLTLEESRKGVENLSIKKRFILATSSELNEEESPTVANETLRDLINCFNDVKNSRGEYVQLFLASQKYNEGIDLKAVRNVHIFEPLLSQAMEKQAIGRAVRFCSHSALNKNENEWTVSIYRYYSDFPVDLSQYDIEKYEQKLKDTMDEYALLPVERKNTSKSTNSINLKRHNNNVINKNSINNRIIGGSINNSNGDSKNKYDNNTNINTREKLKKEIEGYQQQIKKIKKMNYANIRMIDKKIYKESIQRANEMIKINNAIRESAIDCLLTKDSRNDNIKCTYS